MLTNKHGYKQSNKQTNKRHYKRMRSKSTPRPMSLAKKSHGQ